MHFRTCSGRTADLLRFRTCSGRTADLLRFRTCSDASALTQGENVKNVILAERVGVSEVVLINEEIEIIKGMDKNLVGFVLV